MLATAVVTRDQVATVNRSMLDVLAKRLKVQVKLKNVLVGGKLTRPRRPECDIRSDVLRAWPPGQTRL